MGLFNSCGGYPVGFSNCHEPNLDWFARELKRLNERVEKLEQMKDDSRDYTDTEIAKLAASVAADADELRRELLEQLQAAADAGAADIAEVTAKIESVAGAVPNLIDERIDANNIVIRAEIGKAAATGTVMDYFTGQPVTIQQMLDTLASKHLANPVTVAQLFAKRLTVAQLTAKNKTVAYVTNNGGAL